MIPDMEFSQHEPVNIGRQMALEEAERKAASMLVTMRPFCVDGFCAVAGSIRRKCKECGDVDLVCIPKSPAAWSDLADLVAKHCEIETCGDMTIIGVSKATGIQYDIWAARREEIVPDMFNPETLPTNWGSVLLCRTGSREFNVRVCQRAAQCGLRWSWNRGVINAATKRIVASATEAEILKALKMEWVEPEARH